jgi:hypothetical protein
MEIVSETFQAGKKYEIIVQSQLKQQNLLSFDRAPPKTNYCSEYLPHEITLKVEFNAFLNHIRARQGRI